MQIVLMEETIQWAVTGGISLAVGLLGIISRQLTTLNKILIRQDARLNSVEDVIERLPCVKAGFSCHHAPSND